jgi:phosphoesterase RecJ-like protein
VVVDCSDLDRVGNALNGFGQPQINIDHHITNLGFASLNLVEPDAAATAQIIVQGLPLWGLPLSVEVSDSLLTGLLADTIGFRTGNVNGQVLRTQQNWWTSNLSYCTTDFTTEISKCCTILRSGLVNLKFENGIVWTSLTRRS